MPLTNAWCGGTEATSAVVVATIDGSSARLGTASGETLDDVTWSSAETPDGNGVVRFDLSGLSASTRYYWAVEVDSVAPSVADGQFTTLPLSGTAADFSFWIASCAGSGALQPGEGDVLASDRISNGEAFEDIETAAPLFGVHLGDMTYYDLGSGQHGIAGGSSEANYIRMWDDVLLQPRQRSLYSHVPLRYAWDDHDYGPNDADSTHAGRANAQSAYRIKVPHATLPDAEGVFQAWQVGRVQFILSDTRSYRDPNSDPHTPEKTMLGEGQKAWMRSVLESSDAEFLVWCCPDPAWHRATVSDGSDVDHWGNFPHERDELVEMFTETGWVDRMMYIGGDTHNAGVNSGLGNSFGGFPVAQFAPIDARPSDGPTSLWDSGHIASSRGLWGHLHFEDDGSSITVTVQGMRYSQVAFEYVFTAGVAPSLPAPPVPPVIAEARIRSSVTWLGVHRVTGRIIAELPDVTGDPARRLSAYETARMSLPVTSGGPGHVPHEQLDACTDGRSGALVAIVNDLPLWMGLPTLRKGGTGGPLTVPCPSTEAYLTKRKVRDASFVDTDRARVALALAQQAEAINGLGGQGLGLEYDVTDTGDLISIDYKTTDRTSHYKAIRDLCVGGLEWEIAYDWADNSQTTIVKILRIRRRIGRVDAPQAMFETSASGSVISYTHTESWAEGKYATHVTAVGAGQGDDQPASDPVIDQGAVDAGVPWVELIVDPGSNITSDDLLQGYAESQAARVKGGTTALNIEARLDGYPRLGVDALLGDQVSYELESDWHPAVSPINPTDHRLKGDRRLTSWVMHPREGTWTPGLVEDPTLGVS